MTMIKTEIIHQCNKCKSSHLVKNGKSKSGKQKYHCKQCGSYGVLNAQPRYSEQTKELAIRVYQERSSLRGVQRALGISRQTIAKWLKKKRRISLI